MGIKKNKDVKNILVEKTDRLYRNFKDYVLIDESEHEIHLVKENVILSRDSRSHEKFIHGIKVLMAKNYIDNLSEEVKKGLKQKAELGYCTGKPPYGYKKQDKKFSIIDPEPASFMKRAFEIYAEGDKSLTKTIDMLYQAGYAYKPNQPKISKAHLEHLLKNPFYYGVIKFNGQSFKGLHEPLVSKDLFERVQTAFKKDNKPLYRNEHDFAFAGLLTCSECGCTVTAEIKKGKYIYYHCTGWDKTCSQKSVYTRQEDIDKQFEEAIKRITVTEEHKNWIIDALKLSLADEKEYNEERISSLEAQAKKLRDRIEKLYMDKLDGVISESFWMQKDTQWNT